LLQLLLLALLDIGLAIGVEQTFHLLSQGLAKGGKEVIEGIGPPIKPRGPSCGAYIAPVTPGVVIDSAPFGSTPSGITPRITPRVGSRLAPGQGKEKTPK